jgi:hypothetical protein
MKPQSPELCRETPSRRKKAQVLRVSVFRRKGRRFWQPRVNHKGHVKRITTRTQLRAAAEEFAELVYRHFARGGRTIPCPAAPSNNNLEFDIR